MLNFQTGLKLGNHLSSYYILIRADSTSRQLNTLIDLALVRKGLVKNHSKDTGSGVVDSREWLRFVNHYQANSSCTSF